MNPVEHVWPLVGRMFSGKVFLDRDALWHALADTFRGVRRQDILKLYNSMARRLQTLQSAQGRHTRY